MNKQERDWPMIGRRVGFAFSFLMVAGVAARVSYSHIRDVALYGHQPADVALLLPLSVDGLMLIATLAMAEDKAANREPRWWARTGFWFGAVISTTANVAATVVKHGWDPLSIGVAALAPIFLLWAIEIVARPGKPKDKPADSQVAEKVQESEPVTAPEPTAISQPADISQPEPVADDAVSPSLPEAPVSPAISGRGEYGPRNGVEYSERHQRRRKATTAK